MRYLLTILSLSFFLPVQAQNIAIGQWRSHLPYTFAVSVTQSDEAIYFASKESLFALNKSDYSTELFNKVTGLSDAGIQRIRYNDYNDILFIAYTSSNIDLLTPQGVVNISGIKDEGITGDNKIYHIHFQNQFAWLSTGFGIVKLDTEKQEFRFTTFTNLKINSTSVYGDYLYASTDDGLYRVALNTTELFQANFSNWEKLSESEGLPLAYYSNVSQVHDDKLYADVNDSLYVYDGMDWMFFHYENEFSFASLNAGKNRLVASLTRDTGVDKVMLIAPDGSTFSITTGALVGDSSESIDDENGVVWIADLISGMGSFTPSTSEVREYEIDGPYSSNVSEIIIANTGVWVASSSVKPLWQANIGGGLSDGFFNYANNQWTNYQMKEIPELNAASCWDVLTIAVHPTDDRVFAGSYKCGLIEYDGEDFIVYGEDNSILTHPIADEFSTRISGLAFDRDNNLWMSNYGAPAPIVVVDPEGNWQSYTPSTGFRFPTQIVIDFNGYKWFAGGQGGEGILVFDDGGTLNDTSDDRYINLTQDNTVMENNSVQCLELDLDGNVWAGTRQGAAVFECTGQVFDNGCTGRKPVFDEDNEDDYLFKDVVINTIAIDGANQKWIGTNAGLFVLDADIEENLAQFTVENSPLFSNEIVDVAIDGATGEVYVGTAGGILSYRAEATDGRDFFKDVYAFPNPVRPEYSGTIAVKGLTTDANVKITDITGTLVYETTALGGQAVWDGNDYNGRRAASGVYLVYMTSKNGLEKMVTKILVMN